MGSLDQIKFSVIGVILTPEFQKCKFLVEQLKHSFPDRFALPKITPMLDVAFTEYMDKLKRSNLYGMAPFCSKENVVVFVNHTTFIGDSKALEKFIDKNYIMRIYRDFDEMALTGLKNYLESSTRPYVYFIVSILGQTIGTLLIQLFDDACPGTCENFLKLVTRKHGGYQGTPVHRICKTSWVQFGGFKLKPSTISCENSGISHNARGIISMCNDGKHKNNSTQFFICLNPTPWMDTYYVAFGKLVHGEDILRQIENTPCVNDCPTVPIILEECGIFKMDNEPSFYLSEEYVKYQKRVQKMEKHLGEDQNYVRGIYPLDLPDPRDAVSTLTVTKYNQRMYYV